MHTLFEFTGVWEPISAEDLAKHKIVAPSHGLSCSWEGITKGVKKSALVILWHEGDPDHWGMLYITGDGESSTSEWWRPSRASAVFQTSNAMMRHAERLLVRASLNDLWHYFD